MDLNTKKELFKTVFNTWLFCGKTYQAFENFLKDNGIVTNNKSALYIECLDYICDNKQIEVSND